MELRNKVALVTGGAHRVGRGLALALADAGAHVAFTYHTSAAAARDTLGQISRSGVKAVSIECDQQQIDRIDDLFRILRSEFDHLDLVVNSAAIMERRPVLDITPDHWERVFNTNLRGPFFIAQQAARWMTETQTAGCIVNIADTSALRPWPSYVAHTASKSALVAMTRALAVALAPLIRVNAILPGAILKPPDWDDDLWQRQNAQIPLKRSGTPADVAEAVLFCARSEFMTGEALVIDGGRSLK